MSATFSFNPQESENEISFFKRLFDFAKTQDENCIPAIIEEIDKDSGDVVVKPLVNRAMYAGSETVYEDRPAVKVPVAQMRHGGFCISFPVEVGDTGWLFAGDRDWYTAREKNSEENASDNEGAQNPDSLGKRQYIYGFFMPDSWVQCDDEDFAERLKIGTTGDAEAYILVLKDGTIEIHASGKTSRFDSYGMTIDGRVQSTNGERKATMNAADLESSDAMFREVLVVTGKDESKSTEGHAVLTTRRMRVLSDEGHDDTESVDILGKNGDDGVGISSVISNPPSGTSQTTTPVTVTLTDGTTQVFNVVAANGTSAQLSAQITGIHDIQYDITSHQLQVKRFTIAQNGTVSVDANWTMITGGQAEEYTG